LSESLYFQKRKCFRSCIAARYFRASYPASLPALPLNSHRSYTFSIRHGSQRHHSASARHCQNIVFDRPFQLTECNPSANAMRHGSAPDRASSWASRRRRQSFSWKLSALRYQSNCPMENRKNSDHCQSPWVRSLIAVLPPASTQEINCRPNNKTNNHRAVSPGLIAAIGPLA
jgi:hypothetical protein